MPGMLGARLAQPLEAYLHTATENLVPSPSVSKCSAFRLLTALNYRWWEVLR